MKLRALLVVGTLAGLFAPRWLPQPLHPSCCCPEGMEGACIRVTADCSLHRCMPEGAAAVSLSAPRLLLPASQTLPPPATGAYLVSFDPGFRSAPTADPSDPPPRHRA